MPQPLIFFAHSIYFVLRIDTFAAFINEYIENSFRLALLAAFPMLRSQWIGFCSISDNFQKNWRDAAAR